MAQNSGDGLNGRSHGTRPLAALFCAAFFIAQGARAVSPSCETRALAHHQALRAQDLADWEPIDDHTLLIWAKGAMRAHLIRLATPLSGLMEAPIVMLLDGDGDQLISPCGRDAVTLPGGEGARITSMKLLSAKRTAELDRLDPTIAETLNRV